MNELELEDAIIEISGENDYSAGGVLDLATWLNHCNGLESASTKALFLEEARLTPSIVTRSEVELFSISQPRFAIRVYLKDLGFVNCRRLRTFFKALETIKVGTDGGPKNSPSTLSGEFDTHISRYQSSIADSLLRPPLRLRKRNFYFVNTDSIALLKTYGEYSNIPTVIDDFRLRNETLIPFVRSFELTGGLCAQAVLFMATLSMINYSNRAVGIGEITAYAHGIDSPYIPLEGLKTIEMKRYCEVVGLRLSEQTVSRQGVFSRFQGDSDSPQESNSNNLDEAERITLHRAIVSYIRSDIPVLLPVDYRKFTRPRRGQDASVFEKNGLIVRSSQKNDAHHLVLIIGHSPSLAPNATRNQHIDEDLFAFNDPASYPYLIMSLSELSDMGCEIDKTELNGVVKPITPKPVTINLLQQMSDDSDGRLATDVGLIEIAALFHALFDPFGGPQQTKLIDVSIYFYLIDLQRFFPRDFPSYRGCLEDIWKAITGMLTDLDHRWVWCETIGCELWIWSASAPPPAGPIPTDPMKFCSWIESKSLLHGVILVDSGSNKVTVTASATILGRIRNG